MRNAGEAELERAQLPACRDELAEAAARAAGARELVVHSGGAMWMAPLHTLEGTIALLEGDPAAALTTIEACFALPAGDENPFYTGGLYELGARTAAELATRAGDDRARDAQVARIGALLGRLDGAIGAQAGEPSPWAAGCRIVCASPGRASTAPIWRGSN